MNFRGNYQKPKQYEQANQIKKESSRSWRGVYE